MSGPYQKLYPEEEYLVFDGGLDTKFEKALLPVNESPDCLNVEFVNGSVTTRQGAVLLNTISAGSAGFDGLYTRRSNDGTTENMVAFIGTHAKVLGVTTFNTIPSAQSVFTAGVRVGCENGENYLFIGNGYVGPYKYDGTYFTQHGISAPVLTCTLTSGTTGSLTTNGVYSYVYTNVNSALVESNYSPVSATFTVSGAGLAIVVSNIAVGSAPSNGVSQRWLYRTKSSIPGVYYRVTKIADNTTTSYTDTTADANLGASPPTDAGTPPKYNIIRYLNGIMFCNDVSNPNYVWYSQANNPYSFPSTNFQRFGDNSGDLVKGFGVFDNNLVVFCELFTYIWYMPNPGDNTTWRVIKTNSPYGSKSPYCAIKCNVRGSDVILHPAQLNRKFVGFAALMGNTLDPSLTIQPITTAGSDLQSQVIEPDMFNVQSSYLTNISGISYKNRAFISLTYGSNNTTNNRIYVWDYSLTNIKKDQPASWVPWTGLNISQFTIYSGSLYGASSDNTGFVYQLVDTGVYSDNGAAINSYWWSKEHPGFEEDTVFTKDFRYINILYENSGNYYMGFISRTDSDLGGGNQQTINLNSGSQNWGSTMKWGISLWGGGTGQTESRIYFGQSRGKRIQFQFNNQNTANQKFKVYRCQFSYNLRGYR